MTRSTRFLYVALLGVASCAPPVHERESWPAAAAAAATTSVSGTASPSPVRVLAAPGEQPKPGLVVFIDSDIMMSPPRGQRPPWVDRFPALFVQEMQLAGYQPVRDRKIPPDCGLHAFFKAPDLLGVHVKRHGLPIDTVEGLKTFAKEDVETMLGVEKQRDALGCTDVSCMAEIGGSLGADLILYGEVGLLGSHYNVNVTVVRAKGGNVGSRVGKLLPRDDDALAAAVPGLVADIIDKLNKRP